MHDKPEIYLTKLRERDAEAFCNITLTLCHQLDYMLYCVMERANAIFLQKGGIREEMYRARIAARKGNQNQSHQSNQRNQSHLKDGSNQNNLSRRPADSSDSYNSSDKNQADR